MPRNSKQTYAPKTFMPKPIVPHVKPFHTTPSLPPAQPMYVPKPTLGQVVKEGFAFGVGQSLAHSLVGRMFSSVPSTGTGSEATVATVATVATAVTTTAAVPYVQPTMKNPEYEQCLQESKGDKEACSFLLSK